MLLIQYEETLEGQQHEGNDSTFSYQQNGIDIEKFIEEIRKFKHLWTQHVILLLGY